MIKSVLIAAIMTGSIAMILPASAAQITIYGRIDSGVLYQNNFGDSVKENTFTLDSGLNTASRWGINLSSLLNVSSTGTPFFSNPLIF